MSAVDTDTRDTWLTELTLGAFLADEIDLELRGAKRPPDLGALLTAYEPFVNPEVAAERLVTAIETLPWNYELLTVTALHTDVERHAISINAHYTLDALSEADAEMYFVSALHALDSVGFRYRYPQTPTIGRYFLKLAHTGYVSRRGEAPEVPLFVNTLLGLMGLLICDGLLEADRFAWGVTPASSPVFIFRTIDDRRVLYRYEWLTTEQATSVERLTLPGSPTSDELAKRLEAIRSAVGHPATLSAARWYIDSLFGSNGLMRVIQATTAIEILLGDRKESRQFGLTTLLANRLGFLLGHSPSERERIIERFRELYDLRSAIVHSGAATLGSFELNTLFELQNFARDVIRTHIRELQPRPSPSSG